MKYIDYREALGCGFEDSSKFDMLRNRLLYYLEKQVEPEVRFYDNDFDEFFITIGANPDGYDAFHDIKEIFMDCNNIRELLSIYIVLANSIHKNIIDYNRFNDPSCWLTYPIEYLKQSLRDLNIPFDLIKDKDGTFIFPKGVPELDEALVNAPYKWLDRYPDTKNSYSRTLKQISENGNARDCADNLRKTFELFLQEFFENKKNLESNRSLVTNYLNEKGLNSETNQMIQALINRYRLLNDKSVKHNDGIDDRSIEFLMYQTGLFIRFLIELNNEKTL